MPTRVLEVVSGRKYCVNCMQTTPVFSITCFISFLPLLFEQNYRVSGFKLHCRQEVRFQTISFKGFTTARRIQQSAQFIRTYWNDLLANISPDRNPFQKCRSVLGEHSHILSKMNAGKKTDVTIARAVACEQTRPYHHNRSEKQNLTWTNRSYIFFANNFMPRLVNNVIDSAAPTSLN